MRTERSTTFESCLSHCLIQEFLDCCGLFHCEGKCTRSVFRARGSSVLLVQLPLEETPELEVPADDPDPDVEAAFNAAMSFVALVNCMKFLVMPCHSLVQMQRGVR